MISKIRRLAVENCADELIKELKIASLPVNPISIATGRGITVQSWTPTKKGVSGFLMKVGDSFGISYSDFVANPGFINFTVGHELGHYFIPGHVDKLFSSGATVHYSESGFSSSNDIEKEADFFSAALLMPKLLFLPALRNAGEGFAAINQLSRKCNMSLTATAIRFAQFAEHPIAVIISAGNAIEFCVLSDPLQEARGVTRLAKGEYVPAGTLTDKFNNDPNNAGSCNSIGAYCSLDDWFPNARQIEMSEDVIGLGNYGKTLTVLFTHEEVEEADDDIGEWKPRFERRR